MVLHVLKERHALAARVVHPGLVADLVANVCSANVDVAVQGSLVLAAVAGLSAMYRELCAPAIPYLLGFERKKEKIYFACMARFMISPFPPGRCTRAF